MTDKTLAAPPADALDRPRLSHLLTTAREALLKAATGTDGRGAAVLRLEVDELRRDVEGPNPSPLERVLAERVALTWLEVLTLDSFLGQQGHTLALARYAAVDKRRDRATARHLAAIRTLAQVRRLLRPGPSVQVNVGGGLAQVNVGTATPSAGQRDRVKKEKASRSQRPALSKADRGEARPHDPQAIPER